MLLKLQVYFVQSPQNLMHWACKIDQFSHSIDDLCRNALWLLMDQFCTGTIHSPSLHFTSEHVKHTGLMVHLKSHANNMVYQSCSAVTIGIAAPQLWFLHSITNSPFLHTISQLSIELVQVTSPSFYYVAAGCSLRLSSQHCKSLEFSYCLYCTSSLSYIPTVECDTYLMNIQYTKLHR